MANFTDGIYADSFRYLDSLEARPITTRRHIRDYRDLIGDTTKTTLPQGYDHLIYAGADGLSF